MTRRHALRFENGERRGELQALEGPSPITVGRRSENALVLRDASVSGQHAELAVDEEGVLVRDKGSTNGTRVRGERVAEARLSHGDLVQFGNVRATYLDLEREAAAVPPVPAGTRGGEGPPPGAAEPAARAPSAGDGVHAVSASSLERARRVSPAGLVLLLALVLAGGGAWLWLRAQGEAVGAASAPPVVPVADDLLAESYSFEAEGPAGEGPGDLWTPAEGAPAAFALDPSARRTGTKGLSADLAPGEWAEHASQAVPVPRGATLSLGAWARASQARVSAGVRFEDSTNQARGFAVWSAPSASEDFEPLDLRVSVPGGYDRARALVLARAGEPPAAAEGGGRVEVDDVSLVALPRPPGEPAAARVGEYELSALGDPCTVVSLFKIDRVLLSGLVVEADGERIGLAREAAEDGVALFPAEAGLLSFFAEPELSLGGVRTLAGVEEGGAKSHQIDFERGGVRSILLGEGRDLVRIGFAAPVLVRARPSGEGFLFAVPLAAGAEVAIQLAFQEERGAAQEAAGLARAAEQRGELGAALSHWGRVADELPYDEALVREAGEARGRLVAEGLAALRELERRVERARFFRLAEDYRACRDGARALDRRYAGSEIAASARALEGAIDGELAALVVDLERRERERLAAIARGLEQSGQSGLAARVEEYLEQELSAPAPGGGR
jgi:hypothetical protein